MEKLGLMKILKLRDMHKGWFVGNFTPTSFSTSLFEACYRVHSKGEVWECHTHKIAIEINLLIRGKMTMCGKILNAGDIFIVNPGELADPVFLEDCEIVCIKTPSVPGDKYDIA